MIDRIEPPLTEFDHVAIETSKNGEVRRFVIRSTDRSQVRSNLMITPTRTNGGDITVVLSGTVVGGEGDFEEEVGAHGRN